MSTQALALVILAALLHAGWNIAAKRARHGDGGGQAQQLAFQMLTGVGVAVLWAPLGLPASLTELPSWGAWQWGAVALSAFVHLAYFSALLTGYAKADLTVVYPVARGAGPLLAAVGAVVWLHERPGSSGWAGIAAIVLGVLLIAGLLRRRPMTPQAAAGVRWGLLTGALIACYTVIDAWAIKRLGMQPLAFDYWCNVLRVPLLLPLVWAYSSAAALKASWQQERRAVLICAAFAPLAYILVLTALQTAPLSAVAPARECSMLFAALIGGRLLKETDRMARLLGACRAMGRVRAGASCGARLGAGEALDGHQQRAGNDAWPRKSPRPFGLGLQGG